MVVQVGAEGQFHAEELFHADEEVGVFAAEAFEDARMHEDAERVFLAVVAELQAADAHGNVVLGDATIAGGERNLIVASDGVVALVGVSDLIVVRSGDAVLVVPRDRAQDVRVAVEALQRAGLERYL